MKRFLLFGLFAFAIGTAFATTDTDKQAATTKKYLHNELSEIQDTIPAESGTKAVTYTTTAGDIESRTVTTNLGSGTGDTTLPTVGAVNTGLGTKQDEIPARNTNTVMTYTGTAGEIGAKGIYQDTGSYVEQQNNLIDAATFNAALQNALNTEFVCANVSDAHDPVTGNCWLWEIHVTNTVNQNLFYTNRVPNRQYANGCSITNNGDGSITVTTCSNVGSLVQTSVKLSYLAPELQVGHKYKLSFKRTATNSDNFIYLRGFNQVWVNGLTKTITQAMLDSTIDLYANGTNTTGTIWDIRIEEVNPDTPTTTLVPDGYTPLEYIESTGRQWIDTGVKGRSGISVTSRFMIDDDRETMGLIGNRKSDGVRFWATLWDYRMWDATVGLDNRQGHVTTNTIYTTYFTSDSSGWAFSVDGLSISSGRAVSTTEENNMYLFAVNNYGSPQYNFIGKMFYMEIWENGNIARYYIPAKRNSDGVIGVYDKVSGTFFTNFGTGAFTAGPEVSNIVYIPQNQ